MIKYLASMVHRDEYIKNINYKHLAGEVTGMLDNNNPVGALVIVKHFGPKANNIYNQMHIQSQENMRSVVAGITLDQVSEVNRIIYNMKGEISKRNSRIPKYYK
jgi:hypothetical protein